MSRKNFISLSLRYRLIWQCPPQIRLRVNLRPARLVLRIINRCRWICWWIAARTRRQRETRVADTYFISRQISLACGMIFQISRFFANQSFIGSDRNKLKKKGRKYKGRKVYKLNKKLSCEFYNAAGLDIYLFISRN